MTLLITEIYNHNDPVNAFIVFGADQRISRKNLRDSEQEKIFRLSNLNGGIGFFGLAEVPLGTQLIPMSAWIKDYISVNSNLTTLEQFATNLCTQLNQIIPNNYQRSIISGFHISGFNTNGFPEFWYVRNVGDDRETILGVYEVREDFQNRDAPNLPQYKLQVYRNGDLRAHVEFWEEIDESLGRMFAAPDFNQLSTPEDYAIWLKFKLEVTAIFYEQFCSRSIIGRPVNAFVIKNNSN